MVFWIFKASVVVQAESHNPTILHPAFLNTEGIVGDDWEVKGDPIVTPVFSQVVYSNGISFLAEPNKFQVSDGRPPKDAGRSLAPDLAAKYIKRLPHTPYTAIGLNLAACLITPSPQESLVQLLLKEGPWNEGKLSLQAAGFQFRYAAPSAQLNLSCKAGKIAKKPGDEPSPAIIIEANYHTVLPQDKKAVGPATRAITKYSKRCNHLMKTLDTIFELGE